MRRLDSTTAKTEQKPATIKTTPSVSLNMAGNSVVEEAGGRVE